jgi:hypothetical protein
VTGSAFTFPSGTPAIGFNQVSPTVLAGDAFHTTGQSGPALVVDLTKGIVVPVSLPNSAFIFVTDEDAARL